jgi:putative NADPH-quinone reductase
MDSRGHRLTKIRAPRRKRPDHRGMAKHILIIQSHPDASKAHFCHALAESYAKSARDAGHDVRTIDVARLRFPLLRSQDEWTTGPLPEDLVPVQEDMRWAQHVVFFYPLWLGGMPAVLKGFLEQVARPGVAIGKTDGNGLPMKLLAGRSARVVVTMGMPAMAYRWFFFAHSLRALKRNILGMVGISPVRDSVVGGVEAMGPAGREAWLGRMARFGRQGA